MKKFVSTVVAKMKALKVGYQLDPQSQMGSVIDVSQHRRVLSFIEKSKAEGASALVGGEAANVPGYPGGVYIQPTLLAGPLDNFGAQEEIFGSVAYIARFSKRLRV